MSHVDACVDLLNEGSWDPAVANTTAYLTGFVFTVAKVKQSPVCEIRVNNEPPGTHQKIEDALRERDPSLRTITVTDYK